MYITSSVRTIRPVDTVRSSFRPKRYENALIEQRENIRSSVPFKQDRSPILQSVPEPEYPTELAVTQAIASGTFKGLATTAYENAKRYQAFLKSQSKPKFFRRSAATKPVIGTVYVAGYAA